MAGDVIIMLSLSAVVVEALGMDSVHRSIEALGHHPLGFWAGRGEKSACCQLDSGELAFIGTEKPFAERQLRLTGTKRSKKRQREDDTKQC